MKYLWTEDTGAGLHFWKLVNQRLMMKRHYSTWLVLRDTLQSE